MFDITSIHISSRARLKNIHLPTIASPDLAYFCGVLAGDGHIAIRPHKSDYYLTCEGNPHDEQSFYHEIITPLVKRLFHIPTHPRMFQHTYGICIRSKALVLYLTQILGLPINRKYDQLTIPSWVRSHSELLRAYIRGLSDTDFCLSLKKRHSEQQYYPVITGCSKSKRFLEEIAQALETFGLNVRRHYDYLYPDPRLKAKEYTHHRIHIYGHQQLAIWINTIGFSSPKHLAKYERWREFNRSSKLAKTRHALAVIKKAPARVPIRPANSGRWI